MFTPVIVLRFPPTKGLKSAQNNRQLFNLFTMKTRHWVTLSMQLIKPQACFFTILSRSTSLNGCFSMIDMRASIISLY